MTTKKLPLGNQTFAEIIDKNLLYADKTRFIYELLESSEKNYFLSRPRRFGKTLLLHTISELFTGNRKRFKGLWIDQSNFTFPKHPVLFLSLSQESASPEILQKNILNDLNIIAKQAKLEITGETPGTYLGNLILALSEQSKAEVAVLIDEYDAPVTRHMANQELAKANAVILHDFFAILKKPYVAPNIRFTLVTGITRYALTSMDSGANHLVDISLDPNYAGLCGFTLEEFETIFVDRMEQTLSVLKDTGKIHPSSSLEDLKAEIYRWYDGYNWGSKTRVLNPFSILNFFRNNKFDSYWIQSGRPGHLTALIQANPQDFLEPKLESYTSEEIRKSELTRLQPVPVLFHCGYLTVNSITNSSQLLEETLKFEDVDSYTFRFPNHEVSSSYYKNCFSIILKLKSSKELETRGEELQQAFLAMDAKKVSNILSNFFSTISFYQRPEQEKTFHSYVQLILSSMGFNVLTEMPGAEGRLDLCIQLPDKVYLIIELKYCPDETKLTKDERNQALARAAETQLSNKVYNKTLALAISNKLPYLEYRKVMSKGKKDHSTEEELNKYLAEAADEYLTENEIVNALAEAVEKELPKEKINEIVNNTVSKSKLPDETIDAELSKAAKQALDDVTTRNYHGTVKLNANAIIDLGLAVYGVGSKVKSIFGPKWSKVCRELEGGSHMY
jgi:uncharacterized membrane-anchored protein YjiN (DUF445 family)